MKTMREFLVRNFVLDYTVNLFGKMYNAPRASRIIYPLMVITGWFAVTNPDYPTPTLFIWVLYALLATALFFGFIYFRIYPAKWEELDMLQKFQYGFFPYANLTKSQYKEWLKICKEIQK
jgi:hypothetical protein